MIPSSEPKVSVVIPTFQPGKSIERTVQSLDRQSMPPGEFELIIVDDGSNDGTWARLERLRSSRPWMRIAQIDNSGWPSRPRNVGTDLARGEYVLYLDHDDELFPDGLRASYDFASRNRADVLSPKESKTSDIGWGLGNFTEDIGNARPRRGIKSLLPMMPHKMYRTAFLREHQIRFPEGGRMLWEDVYFNVAAYRHAEVISILSSTPVYLWVHTKTNTSSTYGPQDEDFWRKLTALLAYIHQTLPGEEFADARRSTLSHQLGTRVIGRFYTAFASQADRSWVPMARTHLEHILADLTPENLDTRLSQLMQPRAYLLRRGRLDLLDELRDAEGSWVGQSRATDLRWDDRGRLQVTASARWTNPAGDPLTLWRVGDRLHRALPDSVTDHLPAAMIDVTAGVQRAGSQTTLRDRHASVTWALAGETEVMVESVSTLPDGLTPPPDRDAEPVTVVVHSVTAVVVTSQREPSMWDLHVKNSLYGQVAHRQLVAACPLPAPVVVDGRLVRVVQGKAGKLSIEIAADVRALAGLCVPRVDQVGLSTVGGATKITVALPDLRLYGETVSGSLRLVPGQAFVRRLARSHKVSRIPLARRIQKRMISDVPALIGHSETDCAGHPAEVELTAVLRPLPGRYAVQLTTGGAAVDWPIVLQVDARGRITCRPVD